MTWEQIEQHWQQWKQVAKEQWGELSWDDLDAIAGRRETLEGKLQQRYGIAAKQAAQRVDHWLHVLDAPAGRDRQNFASGA